MEIETRGRLSQTMKKAGQFNSIKKILTACLKKNINIKSEHISNKILKNST